jgi:hypothetical protein
MNPEGKLRSLGLELPTLVKPRGSFRPYIKSGSMLYLSGKGSPLRETGDLVPKVGAELSVEQAQAHAREDGLYLLAQIKEALGSLDRVKQVVKVFGMVNAVSTPARPSESRRCRKGSPSKSRLSLSLSRRLIHVHKTVKKYKGD